MTKHKIRKMVNEYLREKDYPEDVKARFWGNFLVIDNISLVSELTVKEILLEVTGIEGEQVLGDKKMVNINFNKIIK